MLQEEVSNLRVVHSEQPLWPLTVGQAGFPQLLLHVQVQHDVPDVSVPVPHTADLLHLLLVHGLKFSVESCLDAINHILHLELREIRIGKKKLIQSSQSVLIFLFLHFKYFLHKNVFWALFLKSTV